MKAKLGTWTDGGQATIDLPRLLETRMLIQANSGGGKSWAIRRLLEQTAGQVQQLVIDPEGEFATLREKFDYVIAAAHDGDAVAHPRTAALLARKLLETGVSAILDIYDLKAHERQAFVRLFCEALVNAPKALWQPTLIVLDEAHVFCPEVGKSESAGAVIDLATRGRKRGFALVAATQRLAKLHKDTAAELLNKLIGRTGQDVDVKRAADELGMKPKDALAKLRPFEPGDWFAFGPAISTSVRQLKMGEVVTTHPKAGKRILRAPPKPTEAIKAVLPKLADLPKEAEQEARTAEDLRRELANTRRELALAKRQQPAPPPEGSKEDMRAAEDRGYARGVVAFSKATQDELERLGAAMSRSVIQVSGMVEMLKLQRSAEQPAAATTKPSTIRLAQQINTDAMAKHRRDSNGRLPPGETAVLSACIQYPDGLERSQLTVLTAYKRSSRDAYIARLKEKGYVGTQGDRVLATDEGIAALPDAQPLPTGNELREFWQTRLPEGERKILEILCAAYPDAVARTAIDEQTPYQRSSRDAYLARLRAKELVEEPSRGMVRASEVLFQ